MRSSLSFLSTQKYSSKASSLARALLSSPVILRHLLLPHDMAAYLMSNGNAKKRVLKGNLKVEGVPVSPVELPRVSVLLVSYLCLLMCALLFTPEHRSTVALAGALHCVTEAHNAVRPRNLMTC